ncbi:exonuclease domain-containing protein [Amycolatopsis pigmentata]|uniref:Exonuclease domain-containing protein n=1 Tax=Amycolatopsis pigmentata TaxID=450801 RepID=A0ABW5G3X8_9PSEU
MKWHERPFVSFDIESTGTNVESDRIVSAAVVTVDPATGRKDMREWLADPGIDIPAEATEIHGITTEYARERGEPAADVAYGIAQALDVAWGAMQPVVIYNAPYDLTLLDRELRRHVGYPLNPAAVVDPLVIDRKVQPRKMKGGHQLGTACGIYGIDLSTIDAHGAAADALATARLAWVLATRHPEIGAMRLPELHARQIDWYAEQAAELETYLRGVKLRYEGQEAADAVHCPREWPLRPVTEEVTV